MSRPENFIVASAALRYLPRAARQQLLDRLTLEVRKE
jgi:O-methyltransferase involved in polyketide biosynthesis